MGSSTPPTHHHPILTMRPPISLTSHIHRSIRQTIPTPIHHHHPSRPFTSSSIKMSSASTTPQPTFSSNYDPAQGNQDLAPLLKSNGGKWTLIESGKGVERGFKFKTFKKTWEFMNLVAAECAVQKHHPEWSNVSPSPCLVSSFSKAGELTP